MTPELTRARKVFVSYAHADEKLREKLDKQLSQLKHDNFIHTWNDRDISAGTEWKNEIDARLNMADIILLLISPDFIASEYCYSVEMERALERHERGEAQVIPIILRYADWQTAPFGKLQCLPSNAKPVRDWRSQDKALLDVVTGIRKVIAKQARKEEEEHVRKEIEEQTHKEARIANVKANQVLNALKHPTYEWRTIYGVSEDIKLPPEEVQKIIDKLGRRVRKSKKLDSKGNTLYKTNE